MVVTAWRHAEDVPLEVHVYSCFQWQYLTSFIPPAAFAEIDHMQFTTINAKTINERTPRDLPALQIIRRSTTGAPVRLCAAGDIGLSGRAAATSNRLGSNALFAEIADVIRTADIAFANLESPLAGEIAPGKMFAAPVTGARTLHDAGFNLLHLANNHVGEYGQAGLAATLETVEGAGITALGAGCDLEAAKQLIRTDVRGLRVGWLGCGRTLIPQNDDGHRYWEFNEQELLAAITHARPLVDVLIVSMHMGLMYMDYPRPEHKTMAERLMETGADLVLMHHAHVLQGIQVTPKGRVCCFNLGNLLYDCEEGLVRGTVMLQQQNEGGIFWFELDKKGVALAAVLPTWVDEDCCVHWATGERGYAILRRLISISRDLEGDFRLAFERQRAERNAGPLLAVLAFHIKHGNWREIVDSLRRIRFEHVKMVIRWVTGLRRTVS